MIWCKNSVDTDILSPRDRNCTATGITPLYPSIQMAISSQKKDLQEVETSGHTFCTSPDSVGYSTFPEGMLSYRWVLNNARVILEDTTGSNLIGSSHEGLKSPTFMSTVPLGRDCTKFIETTWYLRLYESNRTDLGQYTVFSIYLCKKGPPQPITTRSLSKASKSRSVSNTTSVRIVMPYCTFSILDSENRVKHTAKTSRKVILADATERSITGSDLLNKSDLTEFLYDDSLTIQVDATLVCTDPIQSKHEACAIPPDDIRQQMRSLHEEELFTDITIQCGDKQFKAHKAILASQSPVFKRMFQVDMTETRKNSVEISDIDPLVVSDMLAFLYSGVTPNLETLARNLLIAANKYELPRLMAMCENALKMEMTVVNAVELLLHSDLHQATELKKACMEFIRCNATEIYKSDGWKQLKENSAHDHNHSALLCELMEKNLK